MENTIAYFGLKDEDDYMYKKAEAKTEERLQKRIDQNQRFMIVGLLDATTLTEAQIVNVFSTSADLVRSVKKDLKTAPSKIARLKNKLSAEQIAQRLNLPVNWVEKQVYAA